jgi:alkylhydroperoxidase family enzyme
MTGQPRLAPLRAADRDPVARELLAALGDRSELNIFTTLVRNPRVFERWVAYGTVLLFGTLPARDREVMILRTAHRCSSDYEWAQHVVIAVEAGLTHAEIAGAREGADWPGWSPLDATLVRTVDELHDDQRISPETWAALADHYDDGQLVELVLLVGHYHAIAFALNSFGVQLEARNEGGLP